MTAESVLRRSRFVFEEPGERQEMIITEIRHEVLMGCATSSDVSLKVGLNFRLEKLRRVIWPKQGKVCTFNQMFKTCGSWLRGHETRLYMVTMSLNGPALSFTGFVVQVKSLQFYYDRPCIVIAAYLCAWRTNRVCMFSGFPYGCIILPALAIAESYIPTY